MMAKMKTQYGTTADMVESRPWHEDKTQCVLAIIQGLNKSLAQMDTELSC